MLVLLGCCFVCTPWPANKDCGPVVVVTGGGLNNKGKKQKKTKIYKFRDRMANQVASLTKQDKSLYVTRGCSLCLYLVVVVVVVVVLVVVVVAAGGFGLAFQRN